MINMYLATVAFYKTGVIKIGIMKNNNSGWMHGNLVYSTWYEI